MSDIPRSSVDFENEFVQLKHLNMQYKLDMEEKDRMLLQKENLHDIEVKKLHFQLKNVSEHIEEVLRQKVENEKRNKELIDDLSLKNRDLTIDLNNTIQKFQLEIQKTRGSFAKRTSVVAMAMLNKFSSNAPSLRDDKSTFNAQKSQNLSKASDSKSYASKSQKSDIAKKSSTQKKNKNLIIDESSKQKQSKNKKRTEKATQNELSMQKNDFSNGPKLSTNESQKIDEVSEPSRSKSHSKKSIRTKNSRGSKEENLDFLISQINPNLPGVSFRNIVPNNSSNNKDILKIIEDLQYMLKCEEIEKNQIISEHTKALEKIAFFEYNQLDLHQKIFSAEQEKMDTLVQVDIYKTQACNYENKLKEAIREQERIEKKLIKHSLITVNNEGEIELSRAEVADLKNKIVDFQLKLNEKDHAEIENFQLFMHEKNALLRQINQMENQFVLMKCDVESLKKENKELLEKANNFEKQIHQASFQVAQAEEMEIQYNASMREMKETIDNLLKELKKLKGFEENNSTSQLNFPEGLSQQKSLDVQVDNNNIRSIRSKNSSLEIRSHSNRSTSLKNLNFENDPDLIKKKSKNVKKSTFYNNIDANNKTEAESMRVIANGLDLEEDSNDKLSQKIENDDKPLGLNRPTRRASEMPKRVSQNSLNVIQSKKKDSFTSKEINNLLIEQPEAKKIKIGDLGENKVEEKNQNENNDDNVERLIKEVDLKNKRFSVLVGKDSKSRLSTNLMHDLAIKRMQDITSFGEKLNGEEILGSTFADQNLKISDDLNKKTIEIFELKSSLRKIEDDFQRLQNELKLKTIKITQLEQNLKDYEIINEKELKRLNESLDFAMQNLVKHKMMYNDLVSNSDIQKVRYQKQLKIRDFELEILRREIQKYNDQIED